MIARHGSKSVYLKEDLIPRLEKAAEQLKSLLDQTLPGDEKRRLWGKLQGVQLALSYAEEGLRI